MVFGQEASDHPVGFHMHRAAQVGHAGAVVVFLHEPQGERCLLGEFGDTEQRQAIKTLRRDLMRQMFDEESRAERRKTAAKPTEGQPHPGLTPWREIIMPHADVASGRFDQAEFAADLAQVIRGEGSDEYRDPKEFFRRTFITSGLHELLVDGLRRLAGTGGDPVVELQTNFGGGKLG